jgi:hypothetical protein
VPVDRLLQDLVERPDLALDRAAVLQVDDRVLRGGEDVARHDHVRAAEVDQAVAVGHRVLLVEELDGVAVVELAPPILEVGVGGHGGGGRLGRLHADLHVDVRHHRRVRARDR